MTTDPMDEITQAARAYADSVYHELAEYYSRECAVKDFAAGYTAGLRAAKWQPIETAPKDRPIMLACGTFVTTGWWDTTDAAWTNGNVASWNYQEIIHLHPTHWMPLAHPPKEVGDAG